MARHIFPLSPIFALAQWRRVLVWLAGACPHARQCAGLHPMWYCCMDSATLQRSSFGSLTTVHQHFAIFSHQSLACGARSLTLGRLQRARTEAGRFTQTLYSWSHCLRGRATEAACDGLREVHVNSTQRTCAPAGVGHSGKQWRCTHEPMSGSQCTKTCQQLAAAATRVTSPTGCLYPLPSLTTPLHALPDPLDALPCPR